MRSRSNILLGLLMAASLCSPGAHAIVNGLFDLRQQRHPETVLLYMGNSQVTVPASAVAIGPRALLTVAHTYFTARSEIPEGRLQGCIEQGRKLICASILYLHPLLPQNFESGQHPNDLMLLSFPEDVFKAAADWLEYEVPTSTAVELAGFGRISLDTPSSFLAYGWNTLLDAPAADLDYLRVSGKVYYSALDTQGQEAGLAPGDSGSPLYLANTKTVIGLGAGPLYFPVIREITNRQTSRFVNLLRQENRDFIQSALFSSSLGCGRYPRRQFRCESLNAYPSESRRILTTPHPI